VACAPATQPPNFPISTAGAKFLTYVPDSLNDAGRGASVALDKDGNPSVSYEMLKAVLGPTDIPPAIRPGEPQPPAVMVATLGSQGVWSRTSVTPQLTSPRQGDDAKLLGGAFEIADAKGQAIQGTNSALALDASGKHHMVWSSPKGVFYSTDAGGSFSQPETVTEEAATGASVAVASDGTPWVSYVTAKGAQAATKAGGAWTAEQVGAFTVNVSQAVGLSTAIGLGSAASPVVAFGDGKTTSVARQGGAGAAGGAWASEAVPGPGGLGVSMDVDKNGNPHLAYYDPSGGVHHAHSLAGGPWTVTDLGTVAGCAAGQKTQAWCGTGIALDDKGTHYVTWADTTKNDVVLATNASGEFVAQPLPDSLGGATPSIAVSGDGKSFAIAWFDTGDKDLIVATAASAASLALAFSPSPAGSPGAQPSATGSGLPCQPESGTTLTITAPVGASGSGFDKKCFGVAAAAAFSVTFKNDDTGVPHNWALFTNQGATDRLGGAPDASTFITGPDETTYQVKALDPGVYFYHCDIHPTTMNGSFVVAKS
jgi:plastocyanin